MGMMGNPLGAVHISLTVNILFLHIKEFNKITEKFYSKPTLLYFYFDLEKNRKICLFMTSYVFFI